MKNLTLLTLAILFICSCSKDDSVLPQSENCKVIEYTQVRTVPSSATNSTLYSYYEDSIVGIQNSSSGQRRKTFKFVNVNTIDVTTYEVDDNSLVHYGTYYLDQTGFIDSFIRKSANTDEIIYRYYATRNAKNQIVNELIHYIAYGYDKTYNYNSNGDITYVIDIGQGSLTHSDSLVYTMDLNRPDNGFPTYPTEDLEGKRSAHYVTNIKSYKREDGSLRNERRYTYISFDSAGNATSINYQTDNSADGISFNTDYSYDRTYTYNCD